MLVTGLHKQVGSTEMCERDSVLVLNTRCLCRAAAPKPVTADGKIGCLRKGAAAGNRFQRSTEPRKALSKSPHCPETYQHRG